MKFYKFIFLLICLVIGFSNTTKALELNYRLIDKPHIQSFIDSQLDKIDDRFFEFLASVLELETGSDFLTFIEQYNKLGALIGYYRKDCIYTYLEVHASDSDLKQRCYLASQNIINIIRQMDKSLSNIFFNQSTYMSASRKIEFIYQTPIFPSLIYNVSSTISILEPSLISLNLFSFDRNKVADQYSLEVGNQLSTLHKTILQAILEMIPKELKRDLESFLLFYINVLQERADPKVRRDYWAINVFDLNIKVNEFFYSCERYKKILSKQTYGYCDQIHKEWNNILRQTLKF